MSSRRAKALARIRGTRPSRRLLAVLATLLLLSGTAALMTGATFTATTPGDVRVGAANDYTPPTATVSVASVVSGTATVSVDARDARTFVTRVVVEKRPAGSATWTTLCTITSAPWTCSWNTTTETDGDVSLRAIATDSVGLTGTSPVVTTRVANSAAVTLAPLPDAIRATYTLNATVTGAAGRTVSSVFAYRAIGANNWTTITGCAAVTGTSPTCAWNTGTLTNDYEVRVTSTFSGGQTVQAVDETTVDNTLPTVSLSLPTTLSGTVVIAPTVADAHSGVASVTIDYRLSGQTNWVTLCTRTASPYRCSLDTTTLVDGTYEVRATVRDVAGNSAAVTLSRTVSNVVATVSITSPESGDFLRGARTVEVAANASTINSVTVQRRLKNTTAWVDVCVDTTAPYSCNWDTTPLAAGTYELRAVLSHGSTPTLLNSAIVEVIVDNSPLQAFDVQGTPGPSTLGRLDGGDRFTFTYSTVVDLTTIRAGWDGSPVASTMAVRGKNVAGAAIAGYDRLEVPGLGQVASTTAIVRPNRSVTGIPITLTAETRIVAGTPSTVITVAVGSFTSNEIRTNNTAGTLGWSPNTSVRTPEGQACAAAPAQETGPGDVDF